MNDETSRAQVNRRIGFGLGFFALVIFLSYLIRQWLANT